MSLTLQAIMAGNAIKIFIVPPSGMELSRVLRRTADTFSGPDDPGAYVVHEGDAHYLIDVGGLANGTPYFYRVWHWNGAAWVDGGVASATPDADYDDVAPDVFDLLRDRLIAGLEVEVAAGRLNHKEGTIQVRTAPPQDKEEVLPIVTLQLTAESPADRFIGEDLLGESDYPESEGWFSEVRCEITGWSWNPDERIALRRALRRIVMANLPVFDDAGMERVACNWQDAEDFSSFGAPMYMTTGAFTCIAPTMVAGGDYVVIADVPVTVNADPD